jgi:hypothetical protein
MTKKETGLANVADQETLALLQESYPVEQTTNRIQLPRLGMYSQDKTEESKNPKTGKKEIKILAEAGTFYTENQTDEEDENGKRIWAKTDIGTSIEGVILYQRKQLSYYDEATEEYTSSPVYDTDEEIVPLWCNKKEIARGTPKELKAMYEYVADGKTKSKLKDNRILYVEYNGEVYQMNLHGSSMYSFLTYSRSLLAPSVVTAMSSEAKEKGTIAWNQMSFSPVRKLTQQEAMDVLAKVQDIRMTVAMEKDQYVKKETTSTEIVDKKLADY